MITKTHDRLHESCFQYWKPSVDDESFYGIFSIKTSGVELNSDYRTSSLEIKNHDVSCSLISFDAYSIK